jgi:hypothetical protein
VLGLLLIVLLSLLYSVFVSRDPTASLVLLITGAIAGYFAVLFFRNLTGSVGTITRDQVVVQPGRVCGLRMTSPSGTFPVTRFEAVRVEHVVSGGTPIEVQRQPYERVSLVGKTGTPIILVASTECEVGRALARELATALGLKYQEQLAPY